MTMALDQGNSSKTGSKIIPSFNDGAIEIKLPAVHEQLLIT
jgi:hypothetical protein